MCRFSVIICTYNRDKYIYQALESLAIQSFPLSNFEVVVVDNNSTDQTRPQCEMFAHDYPAVKMRYCFESQQGLSYARNRGIKESKGDYLLFFDDDATAFPEMLISYNAFFSQNPEVIAAGGAIHPYYETVQPKWISPFTLRLITGALLLSDYDRPCRAGEYPGGGNAAIKAEAFERYGDFNVALGRNGDSLVGAEEKDLFDRFKSAGESFWFLPRAAIYHHIPGYKLEKPFFNRLTYSMGQSERIRTRDISTSSYYKRVVLEMVKWSASLVLWLYYLLILQPSKGNKLIAFRWNLTRGLLGY